MKKRILFVDDEGKVLDGLKRMLRSMRSEWEMEFALSGHDALEILKDKPFDVVVTDMRMPGMDGCRLLEQVKDLHPQIVRIILSGHSDKDLILNSVGLTHQFLSKPCDGETLKTTIARACTMRQLLEDESLISVISRIDSLPSLPVLYKEVVEEVSSQEASLERIAEIVSKDAGMSAKLLQLVNSAFFGFPLAVSSILRAVRLLGLGTIKTLILSIKIFSQFVRPGLPPISGLWGHSISTGMIARCLATQEDLGQNRIDEAFMAGLLHDVGKLILLDKFPEKYREISGLSASSGCHAWEAEQKVLGTTHAKVGAYLMGIWGLSESLVEAITFHHSPGTCPNSSLGTLTVVHLADSIEHCENGENHPKGLDLGYREKLGIVERLGTSYAVKSASMRDVMFDARKDSFR
jgi:putative nucleotidyltransferase with HDIG domain